MSSRSRFPPFLPGLLFAATCVFFLFAASCVYFEKNKDGGIFGENPKKNARNARGKLPRSRIFGCEEAKVAGLGQKVHGSGSGCAKTFRPGYGNSPKKTDRGGRVGNGADYSFRPHTKCVPKCVQGGP